MWNCVGTETQILEKNDKKMQLWHFCCLSGLWMRKGRQSDRVRAHTLFKCHSLPAREYLNTITGYAYHLLWTKAQTAPPWIRPLDHIWYWLAHNTIVVWAGDFFLMLSFLPPHLLCTVLRSRAQVSRVFSLLFQVSQSMFLIYHIYSAKPLKWCLWKGEQHLISPATSPKICIVLDLSIL